MALISISFAISLLTYNLLQKLKIYDRLALWTLQNLLFYLPPSKDTLRNAAGVAKARGKEGSRKHRRQDNYVENDSFFVPNTIDIDLHKQHLQPDVLSALRFFHDYKWVLNVFFTAVISYLVTELYYFTKDLVLGARPNSTRQVETNFSLLWCIVSTFLSLFVLGRLLHMYFGVEGKAEFLTSTMVGIAGGIASMGVLTFSKSAFDFSIRDAHKNFTEQLMKIPAITEFARTMNFSLFGFGLLTGGLSGIAAALMVFPAIRFGKMYRDARDLAIMDKKQLSVVKYAVSFGLPTIICVLWMPAVRESFWADNNYLSFDNARTLFILLAMLIRLGTFRDFLQAYLDLPRRKLKALQKEPGKTDAGQIQQLLAAPSKYTCIVALQYMAPIIVLILLCFLYTSADLESFFPVRGNWSYNKIFEWMGLPPDYTNTVFEIHNAVWSLFTGALLKALFGYMIWWIVVSHFLFSLYAFYFMTDV